MDQNITMGIRDLRGTATLAPAAWRNYASSAKITWAFTFLLSKNATLSFPEHTHHMNGQVKRSVFVQQQNNHAE